MFRWEDCLEGHILLGMVLNLTAFILLLLTAFSTPIIKSIHFLSLSNDTKFGAFGYCDPAGCTSRRVGYDDGPEVTEWLTRTQILFAVAALFMMLSFFALVVSLLKRLTPSRNIANPIFFRVTALLGSMSAILAEIFALILWVKARHRFNQNDESAKASYGPALWLGL